MQGWYRGSLPTQLFMLPMVNASFAAGVGNEKILSVRFTTGVVASAVFSPGVKRQTMPMAARRCSTCSAVKEIVSDMPYNGMVACVCLLYTSDAADERSSV